MLKYSSEKLDKHKYVFHATKHNYKYPFVNPNYSASNGYGGDAYGKGFYTTDDKEVLNGYVKDLINPIVRKQKLPKGTTILNYNNISPEWTEKIINFIQENFKFLKKEKSLSKKQINIFDIFNMFNAKNNKIRDNEIFGKLNTFLLNEGIDVIKYTPAQINSLDKPTKGYNYLILNKNILNLSEESQADYINNNYNYYNEILEKHLNRNIHLSYDKILTVKEYYPELYEKIKNSSNIVTHIIIALIENDFDFLLKQTNKGFLMFIIEEMILINNYSFINFLIEKFGNEKTYNFIANSVNIQNYIHILPKEFEIFYRADIIKEKNKILHSDNVAITEIFSFIKKHPEFTQEIFDAGNEDIKFSIAIKFPVRSTQLANLITMSNYKLEIIKAINIQKYTLTTQQKEQLVNFYKRNKDVTETLKTLFPELDWYNA